MKPDTSSDSASPNRRLIIAGLAAGACAATIGLLRLPSTKATTSAQTGRKSTPSSISPQTEPSTPEETVPLAAIPAELSHESFVPYLNSSFEISSDRSSPVAAKLVSISDARVIKGPSDSYQAFSLFFDAPAGAGPDGSIYQVRHEKLGEMSLFLSPVGKPGTRLTLEAAFTRKI